MITWLASIALAGTIRVHAPAPVTYVLDGKVVGRLITDVTLTDIPEGPHHFRIEDTFGAIIASVDIVVGEEPVSYELIDRKLRLIEEHVDRSSGPRPPISDTQFDRLIYSIARKKKDKKRIKRLAAEVNQYWFEMRHVDKLLLGMGTLETRVVACGLLAPRTLDPEKTKAIVDQFPEGTFRTRALAAFEPYKRPETEDE